MLSMNKYWLVITIILFLFSGSKAQAKSESLDWKELTSEQGAFRCLFPLNPTKTVKEMDLKGGKLQSFRFETSTVEPVIYFGAWYADFPNLPDMDQNALRINYDRIREGFASTPNIEFISDKDVWADKNLGHEFTVKTANQIVRNRMFLIKKRQYQLIVSADSLVMENIEAQQIVNKFLDSFQLTEK